MPAEWWGEHLLSHGSRNDLWAVSDSPVTREELRVQVGAIGGVLKERGIGEGASVLLRMRPSLTYLIVLLALWSRGAQAAIVDFRLTPAEYEPLVEKLRPQFTITSSGTRGSVTGFQHTVDFAVRREPCGQPSVDGIRLVQFSSGSTGQPKIIGRSVQSILSEVERHRALGGAPETGENVVVLNSLMHNMGLFSGVLHALAVGAVLVIPPTPIPFQVDEMMRSTKASALFGTPIHFDLLSRDRTPPPLPHLRLAVSGGERMSLEVRDRFQHAYGQGISSVYGITEFGLIAGDLSGESEPPQVGRPVGGAEVSVIDDELYVNTGESPYLFCDDTGLFRQGWLRTRDRVSIDPVTGVLSLRGRTDSVVAIGGLKVDLLEVEDTLRRHPSVTEVIVIYDATIHAFVNANEPIEEVKLSAWCRERLSPVKMPKRLHVVEELPRNAMGKLVRDPKVLRNHLT